MALVAELAGPTSARAAPAADDGGDPPPTGRGLVIAGGVVGSVGLVTMIPGVVLLILGRTSREGLGSAIGGLIVGLGAILVATGTGLLVPGLVRRKRYREYESQHDAGARIGTREPSPLRGFVLHF